MFKPGDQVLIKNETIPRTIIDETTHTFFLSHRGAPSTAFILPKALLDEFNMRPFQPVVPMDLREEIYKIVNDLRGTDVGILEITVYQKSMPEHEFHIRFVKG